MGTNLTIEHNRTLIELLRHRIELNTAKDLGTSIMVIDITNYYLLRSLYGEEVIDNELVLVREKLSAKYPDVFTISDNPNYIAIIIDKANDNILEQVAQNITSLFQSHISKQSEVSIYFKTLIVAVLVPTDTTDAEEALLKCFTIISSPKPVTYNHYYSCRDIEKQLQSLKKELHLANHLRTSIFEKKLRLAFQPIIKTKTGHIAHYECLLRILDEKGNIISVGPFIPIAEEMGFISLIDELVLELVAEELNKNKELSLAFNVSAQGIYNLAWKEKFMKLIGKTGLAHRVIVEITETSAQQDLRKSVKFITDIQTTGAEVALDDFGAGYTSFKHLQVLPVDIIKIDGAFIKDIHSNVNSLHFVKALLNLTHSLGLKAIAEFVENGVIAKSLIDLGVDYMQGNYFSPAVNYRHWEIN